MFPELATSPFAFQNIGPDQLPSLAALARLVESVPYELIVIEPGQYAGLIASITYLRATTEVFSSGRIAPVTLLRMKGFKENPIALIRAAMAGCPDEAPAPGTTELPFVTDADLRESIRLDMSAAHQGLSQGEWKGATILAGSAVEALLLWALQEHERKEAGIVATTVAALVGSKVLKGNPGSDLEGPSWHLLDYVEVAAHLGIINPDTATLVRLAKDFRNLIHPGRAARLGQKCDRATALGALAAVEAVARDLTP